MEPVLHNNAAANDPQLRDKVESISLCLRQLEEESRGYGFGLSAFLIRVAANSFGYK